MDALEREAIRQRGWYLKLIIVVMIVGIAAAASTAWRRHGVAHDHRRLHAQNYHLLGTMIAQQRDIAKYLGIVVADTRDPRCGREPTP